MGDHFVAIGTVGEYTSWVNTRLSQKFCHIFVPWGTIHHLQMLLSRLWRWRTTESSEMPSPPDTLQALHTGFSSLAISTGSEFTTLPDYHNSSLPSEISLLWSSAPSSFWWFGLPSRSYGLVLTRWAKDTELDNVAHSSIQAFNSHSRREAMYNLSAHQLPRYYQPQWVLTTARTVLVTLCTP